jgi:hypothetical protein
VVARSEAEQEAAGQLAQVAQVAQVAQQQAATLREWEIAEAACRQAAERDLARVLLILEQHKQRTINMQHIMAVQARPRVHQQQPPMTAQVQQQPAQQQAEAAERVAAALLNQHRLQDLAVAH